MLACIDSTRGGVATKKPWFSLQLTLEIRSSNSDWYTAFLEVNMSSRTLGGGVGLTDELALHLASRAALSAAVFLLSGGNDEDADFQAREKVKK